MTFKRARAAGAARAVHGGALVGRWQDFWPSAAADCRLRARNGQPPAIAAARGDAGPVDLPPQRRLGKLDEGIDQTARAGSGAVLRRWLRDATKKAAWVDVGAWKWNRTSDIGRGFTEAAHARTLLS